MFGDVCVRSLECLFVSGFSEKYSVEVVRLISVVMVSVFSECWINVKL